MGCLFGKPIFVPENLPVASSDLTDEQRASSEAAHVPLRSCPLETEQSGRVHRPGATLAKRALCPGPGQDVH